MSRLAYLVPFLAWCACSVESVTPPGELMEGEGNVAELKGLERVDGSGPYVTGGTERFRVHLDETRLARLEWSASGGSLNTSGRAAEWRLPRATSAELSVKVVRRDGTEGTATWRFALTPQVDSTQPMSAQAALLATPMPVLDGGSLEVAGGACAVRYEGSTNNVGIAFTTLTHPSVMYGRWNGNVWSLEVVDALGFNTGGFITQHVAMQVEANGTPHLVYVRDFTVMYATKVGGAWVRERVDAVGMAYSNISTSIRDETDPSIALAGSTPSVLFLTGLGTVGSPYRPVVAIRTGANAWTRTVVAPNSPTSSSGFFPWGELVIDGSGRHLFPAKDDTSPVTNNQLVAWTSSTRASVAMTAQPGLDTRGDTALAGPNRLLVRTASGLFDVTLNATFPNTTMTWSTVEASGSSIGDVAWSQPQSRPVLLHHHSGALELVTTNASGFWTYTQLGSTSNVSAGLTVHPTTGEASICYQFGGRIMFQ